MHPYTMLKDLLREIGAELTSENWHYDAFGSYTASYENRGCLIRLIWDGRDGWGFVQRYVPGSGWADATDFLTEGDLEGEPKHHAKLEQFRQVVAALLRGAA